MDWVDDVNAQTPRSGIGFRFYQAFEDWVSGQEVNRVSLCAIEANELGLKFWKSLGFEVIHKSESRKFVHKTHVEYVMSRAVEKKV